jgi:hypothetical protein
MIGARHDWQRALADQAAALDERQFGAFLRFHEIVGDDDLCDAIDIDARARASAGLRVSLDRYLAAVADLESRRVVLDAVLEASLRSLRQDGSDAQAAVDALKAEFPGLAAQIDTAAVFDEFLASSIGGSGGRSPQGGAITLPATLGDRAPDGQRRYMLVRPLGSGSQATVYLATDAFLSSPDQPAWVAVKIFPRRARDEAESAAIAESRSVRRIDHPSVVHVLDRGRTDDGNEFVVFEYVEGAPLQRAMDPGKTGINPDAAARVVADLAQGLQAAHNAGVLHRDIKPANVLIANDGRAKIADFGLADRIRVYGPARGPAGSFAFMSPEQYRCDPRASLATTDIYSLGGVLFWLLTGRLPNGDTSAQIEQRLWKGESATPLDPSEHRRGLDPDLVAITRRAVAPSALDRYASADALANDLDDYLARRPLAWTRPGALRRARLLCRRSPGAAVMVGVGILTLMAGSAAAVAAWRFDAIRELRMEVELSEARATSAEAERDAAVERAKVEGVIEMVNASRIMLRDPETPPNEGWLRSTIVNEAVFGPVVLGMSEQNGLMWRDRIDTVRYLIVKAGAEGRSEDLETLVWQSLLGYWLVRAERYPAAVEALDEAIAAWTPRLAATDRFLSDLRALRAAAALGVAVNEQAGAEEIGRLVEHVRSFRPHTLPENLRETIDGVLSKAP